MSDLEIPKDSDQTVMVKPLMDTTMAATYLGCSKSWLEKARVYGIPKIKYTKLGRKVIYRRQDLDIFLEEQSRTSTSENQKLPETRKQNREDYQEDGDS